ncbi:MAG: isocitrate dehydrogenase (NADP(+)) [Candidatus Margulisiibacteriota bacterium]
MADRITIQDNKLHVPNEVVIPYIEGDGIGADITRAMKIVIDSAIQRLGKRIEWLEILAGEKAFHQVGEWLPEATLTAIREYVVAIKGPLTTPVGEGIRSLNVTLRQVLDLYACVRPVRYFDGVESPLKHPEQLDVCIFRENTEDVYAGYEWAASSEGAQKMRGFLRNEFQIDLSDETGIGIKPISKFASQRLVRKAMVYALENRRKTVTLVHKGNIMKYTEGAFRTWGYELIKSEFSDKVVLESDLDGQPVPEGKILVNDRIADNMFQQILIRPSDYDVIVTTNLNGDYLSDACAAQVGGLGLSPGGNIGEHYAVFEATHGTAPKYANLNKANPSSLILSAVMMLEYLGWQEAAKNVTQAMSKAISTKRVTYDLARQMEGATELGSLEFAQEIIRHLV